MHLGAFILLSGIYFSIHNMCTGMYRVSPESRSACMCAAQQEYNKIYMNSTLVCLCAFIYNVGGMLLQAMP